MAVQVENQIRYDEQKNQYDADTAEAHCKHKYDLEVVMTEHKKADRAGGTQSDPVRQQQSRERPAATRQALSSPV